LKDEKKTSKGLSINTPPFKPHNEVSQKSLLDKIKFGGVAFDNKPLDMTSPLYIDMSSAPNTQNIMPKISACPSHCLYLTSFALKNVQ
jgi:hypothetical protein